MKRVLLFITVLVTALLCGCGKNGGDVPEISYEPVEYSIVKDSRTIESIETAVNGYLNALTNHSFNELPLYADVDLPICIDQTAFEDYIIGLGEARLESIETDIISENSGSYYVKVRYELIFTGQYTDFDGSRGIPGTVEKYEQFTMKQGDNGFIITAVEPTGEG